VRYFSETGELEDIRGSSESLLKELIRFGIIRLRETDPPMAVAHRRVRFLSGDEREYDRILCATGYMPRWIMWKGANCGPDRTDTR
jgi:hypothetical protein